MQLYGAIEAGGTKFVCAVAASPGDPFIERMSFPTTTSSETIDQAISFFKKYTIKGLGIASFGPVDLDPSSPTYGYITATPKLTWVNTDLLGPLRLALNLPMVFDTDVNGAALGEMRYGGAQDVPSVVYFTIGTGIAGGSGITVQIPHGLGDPRVGQHAFQTAPRRDASGPCLNYSD